MTDYAGQIGLPGNTDWEEVRRRMEAVRNALEHGPVLTPEEKKRVLKARAAALARTGYAGDKAGKRLEVIEFSLANEGYALESAFVREVYPLRELAHVPCTPSFILGITSVRGQILPVVDFRRFFDLPGEGLSELDKVIVVRSGEIELAIRADVILGVRSVPLDDIQPALPTMTGIRQEYLRGITSDQVAVLDIERLLAQLPQCHE